LTFVASSALSSSAAEYLPQNRTLIGLSKYRQIVAEGLSENWSSLPIADRMTRAALTMKGTPYARFTLEIDDHVESAAVNFEGLDCWTFFEAALGLARMFGRRQTSYSPSDLLREIEWTRYRGGRCNGNYLDRIHYLEEWFRDNDARDNVRDITRSIAPTIQLKGRKIDEMTVLWKSYRYLKNNPELRSGMARIEAELQRHPFHYIPKNAVAAIEPKLQSGDIIGIVTHKAHVYCSHVGLALRTQDGIMRFMHASADKKRVIIDKSVSGYLADFKSHAGIIVARPR
jgi:hypothetical protein